MVEAPALDCRHLATLQWDKSVPALTLEVYQDPSLEADCGALLGQIQALWPHFLVVAEQEKLFAQLALKPESQAVEIDLTLVGNATMQTLNRDYRQKDQATDVLSFTLLADAPDPALWLSLPVVQLGSIFLSVEWAQANAESGSAVERFLLERLVHGLLHLMGQHHDTMEDYQRVVSFQNRVLIALEGND